MSSYFKLKVAFGSNIGIARNFQEDSVFAVSSFLEFNDYRVLLIVADGKGGLQANEFPGKIASQLVVDTIHQELSDLLQKTQAGERQQLHLQFDPQTWETYLVNRLQSAIEKANKKLYDFIQRKKTSEKGYLDVTSTFTCALIRNNIAIIANVGDCRTYLFRENNMQLITNNSPIQLSESPLVHFSYGMPLGLGLELEFNRGPELGREKADIGDKSKFLSSVQINLWTRYLQIGDSLLLCSDGLWGEMDENEIVQHLQELSSPERVIKRLIDTANTNGGHDNIAVAICQMVSN